MIVIPMMGRSSRFYKMGYTMPKYQLPLAGGTVFDWVLKSFQRYYLTETFVFVVRSDRGISEFVKSRVLEAGIANYEILVLDGETRGQADTVAIALERIPRPPRNEPLVIFNADSFSPNFTIPESPEGVAGSLDVFTGEGDAWSFVLPGEGNSVVRTAEKERISDLCSNGMYIFRDVTLFRTAFDAMISDGGLIKNEYYVAPMYNYLLSRGHRVLYRIVSNSDTIFCGVPAEYENLIADGWGGF